MANLRTTNYLLLVIAACLSLLAAKEWLPGVIPEAKAAPMQDATLYGCYKSSEALPCEARAVRVDGRGQLIVVHP